MWQCDCGEFNNDEHDFCTGCKQVRVTQDENYDPEKHAVKLENMFKRVQDFVLADIALCALIALYCFIIGLKEAVPIIVILLFQILLVLGILRMIYQASLTSERNSIYLNKIHKLILDQIKKEEEENENNNDQY